MKERDAAVEKWLLVEVAPVYDAMKADPERAVDLDDAFDAVRVLHAERVKKSA